MSMQVGEAASRSACRAALLWDLDNVAPPRKHLASLAEALCGLVKADEPLIAAAHRTTFRTCRETLSELGIQVLSGGRRRNGADRLLLARATELKECGVERFIVASNDYRFARIASLGELHVLTLSGSYVSQRLQEVASTLTVLGRRDDGCWCTNDGAIAKLSPPPRTVVGGAVGEGRLFAER